MRSHRWRAFFRITRANNTELMLKAALIKLEPLLFTGSLAGWPAGRLAGCSKHLEMCVSRNNTHGNQRMNESMKKKVAIILWNSAGVAHERCENNK